MKTIKVDVSWEDKNYCCGWGHPGFGAILSTNKSLPGLKAAFEAAIKLQVAELLSDGEAVPEWLASCAYCVEYTLTVSALLRQAEQFTTMAVISRVTGINQKLLSHYANSLKIPRPTQRERIINGLHSIGQQFLAVR